MTIGRVGDFTVARLEDQEITLPEHVQELGEEIFEVLDEADPPDLLIDFREVELLSSRMLGILVRLLKRARQKDGRLRLCCIQPPILHILDLTNLNKVFDIYEDVEEAIEEG